MLADVTIPRTEYRVLKTKANRYDRMVSATPKKISVTPPEKSAKRVVAEFKKTGKYSKEFLLSLEKGLGRSSYFTK